MRAASSRRWRPARRLLYDRDMGKSVLVALAMSSLLGCVHAPKNKPRAYIAGGAAVVLGGAFAYAMSQQSCNGGDLGDDIGCSVGSGLMTIFGLTLVGAGVATVGITALAPEAE
jgi:hypothetical protein